MKHLHTNTTRTTIAVVLSKTISICQSLAAGVCKNGFCGFHKFIDHALSVCMLVQYIAPGMRITTRLRDVHIAKYTRTQNNNNNNNSMYRDVQHTKDDTL